MANENKRMLQVCNFGPGPRFLQTIFFSYLTLKFLFTFSIQGFNMVNLFLFTPFQYFLILIVNVLTTCCLLSRSFTSFNFKLEMKTMMLPVSKPKFYRIIFLIPIVKTRFNFSFEFFLIEIILLLVQNYFWKLCKTKHFSVCSFMFFPFNGRNLSKLILPNSIWNFTKSFTLHNNGDLIIYS